VMLFVTPRTPVSGTVHSLAERDAVVGTAFSARGVARVVDHLRVGA
jgi:osmotically-inducible protein OsmY